ncbi:HNH endonuclease [Falsihalocynthiibacter sp. S25ZX9]
MSEIDLIAQDAYETCLVACEAFEDDYLSGLADRVDQLWWKDTFKNHSGELAHRIQGYLLAACLTMDGCLEIGTPATATEPEKIQRVFWRGRRQKVYQLVAWGIKGELPSKKSVIRHLCNNRLCVHPKHLKVGTQAQNLRDQKQAREKDWPHL